MDWTIQSNRGTSAYDGEDDKEVPHCSQTLTSTGNGRSDGKHLDFLQVLFLIHLEASLFHARKNGKIEIGI